MESKIFATPSRDHFPLTIDQWRTTQESVGTGVHHSQRFCSILGVGSTYFFHSTPLLFERGQICAFWGRLHKLRWPGGGKEGQPLTAQALTTPLPTIPTLYRLTANLSRVRPSPFIHNARVHATSWRAASAAPRRQISSAKSPAPSLQQPPTGDPLVVPDTQKLLS